MMNQDNPYAMNQTCKVCGEPAAGFHFGAFTCEGCKSFFGRSYNNLSSISDCKNNGECIINKKNRTACKACRLKKCLMVGMSKSGSRYGRRSNWFKIHCLLQEQQQQAVAAMAAHHNSQQSGGAANAAGSVSNGCVKGMSGGAGPAAAAAALGMLGHATGGYAGLYATGPPRSKEELMMLGLDGSVDYGGIKHPSMVASPSVSSPDSHNSDSSVEVSSVRGNSLLQHGSGCNKQANAAGADASQAGSGTAPGRPAQLRKDLAPFLPLPFPGLGSLTVMPPPAFLPPSHLLFPGYHPALYSHHQGLLKPTPEQQQAAVAAAAVQHLFNSSNASGQRFAPQLHAASPFTSHKEDSALSPNHTNNNHLMPNGSRTTATDELTKRFYLDAVLKSQQHSPPPLATKLPPHNKQDYSISALVTPNSESGRERVKSRQSNGETEEEEERDARTTSGSDKAEEEEELEPDDVVEDDEEDLVVSMTPPSSPAQLVQVEQPLDPTAAAQDNPIDLSMKTTGSTSSQSSCQLEAEPDVYSDSEAATDKIKPKVQLNITEVQDDEEEEEEEKGSAANLQVEDNSSSETVNTSIEQNHNNNNNNNNNNNSNNNNNNNNSMPSDIEANESIKRKLNELMQDSNSSKRLRLELQPSPTTETAAATNLAVKVATSTALDLTNKV